MGDIFLFARVLSVKSKMAPKQQALRKRVVRFYETHGNRRKKFTVDHFWDENVPVSTVYRILSFLVGSGRPTKIMTKKKKEVLKSCSTTRTKRVCVTPVENINAPIPWFTEPSRWRASSVGRRLGSRVHGNRSAGGWRVGNYHGKKTLEYLEQKKIPYVPKEMNPTNLP